ncbi:MAG: hypothetical protein JST68_27295 [Bacteroidetes bacterium]|nr:hypothetical protein [Bacteroidota bacterium]
MAEDILDESVIHGLKYTRRRSLLPLSIKIFTWIFLVFGALAVPVFILGLVGGDFQMHVYGLAADAPLTPIGIELLLLVVYKGIVAYALWFEWDAAIWMGIVDAIVGLALCAVSTVLLASFQFEILLLIPYLIWLSRLNKKWANAWKKAGGANNAQY